MEKQLDKILEAAPALAKIQTPVAANGINSPAPGSSAPEGESTQPLASYIKAKNGDSTQTQRFLVTADWLRRRGNDNLTTAAVSKILRDQQQKKLGNPADCLNQNVTKGYCEKTGNGFFITPDGMSLLGH